MGPEIMRQVENQIMLQLIDQRWREHLTEMDQLRQGIDRDTAKKITKLTKDSKLKVQAQINGEKLRVQGKKRDDLQQVMALLREAELEIPLQFDNFRD